MKCKLLNFFSCTHKPDHYVFLHSHATYELIYYVSGSGKTTIDGEVFTIEPGSLVLIPANTIHDEKHLSESALMWCTFMADDLGDLKTSMFKPEQLEGVNIIGIFEAMSRENKQKEYGFNTLMNILLSQILLLLRRVEHNSDSSENEEVDYAKNFLKSNYQRKINLQILSEHIGYSYDHFRHLFKKKTTISPNQYLINIRISKAKEFLEASDDLVRNIALKCGFHDTSRFISLFRAETGLTPQRYREIIHDTQFGEYKVTRPTAAE